MTAQDSILDPVLTPALIQDAFRCANRRDLDALTRKIWKRYDNGRNDAELAKLRAAIIARRAALERNDPR